MSTVPPNLLPASSVMSVVEVFFFHVIHITAHLYWCVCVSVHPRSSSIPPNLWLAPSCPALPPLCFPFTDTVPPSLPSLASLQHFPGLCLPCWSRSDRGQTSERGRGGRRNVKLCLVPLLSKQHQPFLFFPHLLLRIPGSFSKRWQSMVSDSEVGTFDRHFMWQQMGVI